MDRHRMVESNLTLLVVVPVPVALVRMTKVNFLLARVARVYRPTFVATQNMLPVVVVVVPTVGGTTHTDTCIPTVVPRLEVLAVVARELPVTTTGQ